MANKELKHTILENGVQVRDRDYQGLTREFSIGDVKIMVYCETETN